MTKVEHTKTHKTTTFNDKTFGGILKEIDVLVTDVELVLVETNTYGNYKEGTLVRQTDVESKNYQIVPKSWEAIEDNLIHWTNIKPILISKNEKIEVGDWFYHEFTGHIRQAVKITNGNIFIGLNDVKSNYILEGCVKILALPENFSPSTLKDIVDGKLKEGECLVECEQYRPSIQNLLANDGVMQIKLNPHITIYPVEEKKMYTREDMCQFGLWLGNNLSLLKNKRIDDLFKQFENIK